MRGCSWVYPIFIYITSALASPLLKGQSLLSRLALMDLIPQNTQLHATYAPPGKVFFGLPVLSQISVHANSRISLNEAMNLNMKQLNERASKRNRFIGSSQIADFYIGANLPRGHYFSFFGNERIQVAAHYPKGFFMTLYKAQQSNTMNLLDIDADNLQANLLMFRETGINYSMPVTNRWRIGFSAKYLQGIATLSMQDPTDINLNRFHQSSISTRIGGALPVMDIPGRLKNELSNNQILNYMRNNHNRGFAVSLGAQHQVNYFLNIAHTFRNVGFIRFRDYLRRYRLTPSAIKEEEVLKAYQDNTSLRVDIHDLFNEDLAQTPFRQWLPFDMLTTANIQMTNRSFLAFSNLLQAIGGRLHSYQALSLTSDLSPYFAAGASLIRYPQHVRVGLAMNLNLGPIQLYAASGDVIAFFKPIHARLMDVNIGLNVITGRRYPKVNRVYCP